MSEADLALRKANLAEEKKALLEKRLRGKLGTGAETQAIARRHRDGPVPLSLSQERLWFSDRIEPGSALHNAPSAIRLEGSINVAALQKALSEIVRRHEALRTTFDIIDGQPAQVIAPPLPVDLPVVYMEEHATPLDRVTQITSAEARRPIDISKSPCLRAQMFRLKQDDHVLFFITHHLVFDGWSKGVLIREMIALYEYFSAGRAYPLPDLPIQYADFAIWQRERLRGHFLHKHIDYWRKRLDGAPSFELPTDKPRPGAQTFNGMRHWVSLPPHLSQQILSLSKTEGATPFIVLLAGFKILLNRYTGCQDIVIGTHVAGRNQAETEGLIGFFVNQLPLRTAVSESSTCRELIGRVRETALEGYQYQEVPFEKVVQALGVRPNIGRRPFFQILFSFHNAPRPPLYVAGLKQTLMKLDDSLVRFDLEFDLWWGGSAIEGFLVQNTDLYARATIEGLIGDYEEVLKRMVTDPEQRISELPIPAR
jgi:non-ribosomal peptide synthetase component F